jgi:hypothetical protein
VCRRPIVAAFLLRGIVHRELLLLLVLYNVRQYFLICNMLSLPLLGVSPSAICACLPVMLLSPLFWVAVYLLLSCLSFATHKLLSGPDAVSALKAGETARSHSHLRSYPPLFHCHCLLPHALHGLLPCCLS